MMCGSLGHFGAERRDQALRPVPGSLTVCAGDLCGRLAGGELSILQTFRNSQHMIQKANPRGFSQRVIVGWDGLLHSKHWRETGLRIGTEPKNLSEEFDPGSE